ncbi:24-hydroxycholesterol 7-alpha-hydroxylase isoform X2 [Microcaecilia unicolor]|uniref:24-hydroxycholesterol 7-alpha-hydroxylase isoform X2 n=1 Tax=Microcaecilia unicolor TaxID=1415580 RepID=A0A6P7XND3_9AMPH|nr:24-hydroxycholesterol 7-alpha-hydroxylase isoform X2 [Microcaecilia unicolor]
MELSPAAGATVLLLSLTLAAVIASVFSRRRSSQRPPCIGGWIPWLGAALWLRKAPLQFIEQSRIKYGPVFTIVAVGHRLTFVTDEEGCAAFFKSKQVDFLAFIQRVMQKTASINKESFYKSYNAIREMMKSRMSQNKMYLYSKKLNEEFYEHLEYLGMEGTMDLYNFVRQIMVPVVLNTLFGKETCLTNRKMIAQLEEHFCKFDEKFEYGALLPEYLFRDWSKSKHWLLRLVEKVVRDAERNYPSEDKSKTLLHHLLDTLKGNATSGFCLVFLWASQTSVYPATFWSLAFIISQPAIYKTAMEEITAVFGKAGNENVKISETELQKLPFLKCCILESLRLRSPGAITRIVMKPMKIHNYTIPPGDVLMMSPFWMHRNPKYFPEPEVFKPERWKKANIEKNIFLDGFIGFGGGQLFCPGRWLVLMEIHMLVALILYEFELTPLDPVPDQSNLHLAGALKPSGPCRIQYKQRMKAHSSAMNVLH